MSSMLVVKFFFMVPASSFTDKLDGCQGDVFVA